MLWIGLQFVLVPHDRLLQELSFRVRSKGSMVSLWRLRDEGVFKPQLQ